MTTVIVGSDFSRLAYSKASIASVHWRDLRSAWARSWRDLGGLGRAKEILGRKNCNLLLSQPQIFH